ncbi:alcohol oxidase [Thozetella sp. PMI_491]|nr:alcohol oxidase [Thozetella sp. PMI_491]
MRGSQFATWTLLLGGRALAISSATKASAQSPNEDEARQRNTYDYIIVGGGVSGLVVANRLTEDSRHFDNSPRAIVPWWANDLDTSVMVFPTSAPVAGLNNATFGVAEAAVVGGGSVVNGMAYFRGSRADYDAWEELGNKGWGWDGMLPYFRKSTTFTPPSPSVASEWNITWQPSVYDHGPLHITIPDFIYPDVASFRDAWRHVPDVDVLQDVDSGLGPGVYWTPSSVDRRSQTRATSRLEYLDPILNQRPNLHLLTKTTATEILFRGLAAVGVRVVSSEDNSTTEMFATKEVILSAGAIQTPQLLQVSGIGPKAVLEPAGIQVKKDLPAVGANLQDHATTIMVFNITNPSFPNPTTILTNSTYNASVWEEYWVNHTGPIASGSSSMAVLLSLSQLSTSAGSISASLNAQDAIQFLPNIYKFPPLLKGFLKQRDILSNRFNATDAAVAAFPFPGGGAAPAPYLKPLSRGTVALDPTSPHGLPTVQYNTLMNPVDSEIILAIVKHARKFWARPELAHLGPIELLPGAGLNSDGEILSALRSGVLLPSLAHPAGTCAMLPEALGGCVGPDLMVYGLRRLSVVDASIMPLIPGAPLQATVYAVAEKAADLIKARD